MRRIRLHRPSPSMVVATIALVISLGGNAVAAFGPFKGDKLIKKHSLSGNRLRNHTLTGTQIDLSRLGVVPNANHANFATTATTANRTTNLAPPEGWHEVGTPGEPAFQHSWTNTGSGFETVAFYKDREGVVHLKGTATGSGGFSNVIFQLPPGYRPAAGKALAVAAACACTTLESDSAGDSVTVHLSTAEVVIYGPGLLPGHDGAVILPSNDTQVSLDGITFRAAS